MFSSGRTGQPSEDFATRANSGAALERITPAGARIYEILHNPEAFTVQTIAAAGHIKGRHHAKVVMVKSGGQHLMTMLPADHRAALQKLEKIAGEPASLETEEEFESLFPNCAKGAMRPFGNLYGLPTCVDKRLTQEDYIVFEAGAHTDAIKLNDRGYEQIVKPRVEDRAIKVHPIQRA